MNRRKAERWISMDVDGELSSRRRSRLAGWLERHPDMKDLQDAWLLQKKILHEYIPEPVQTPEAAWQNIRRMIRAESAGRDMVNNDMSGYRFKFASAMAVALLMILAGIFFLQSWALEDLDMIAHMDRTEVEWVESDLPDAMSMVYEDADTGLTVIWVLTAENGKEEPDAG